MTKWLVSMCAALLLLGGCARTSVTIATETRTLTADDGYPLVRYRLMDWDGDRPRFEKPRGVVYYVQGSDDRSALDATEKMAAAAAMGLDVVMIERRGVSRDGLVSRGDALTYASKQVRVNDTLTMICDDLKTRTAGGPVLLVGASEGGDVAAAVAVRESRLTHVVLLASGGGLSQADELRSTWQSLPPQLGVKSLNDLDAVFADIRSHPDADTLWYGHPYRRWASYAFERPVDDLLQVSVPILLIQGDADTSVPVASARMVRDAFTSAKKTNLTYLEYPQADHRFALSDGSSAFPRIEVDLVSWLRETGAMPAEEANEFAKRVKRAHPEAFRSSPQSRPFTPPRGCAGCPARS